MDNVVQLNDSRPVRRVQPYSFAPEFEESLAYLLASRPKFGETIGRVLEPDALGTPQGKLVVKLVQEIVRDTEAAPKSNVVVIQRAARWREAGKITQEEVESVGKLFDDVEDDGVPPTDAILSELVPVLRERMRHSLLIKAVEDAGKGKALGRLAADLLHAEQIGEVGEGIGGAALGLGSFDGIRDLLGKCRISTGIDELDFALGGGLPVGTLGIVIGASGEGKSMFLNHGACQKVWDGGFVGYATLEIAKAFEEARAIANLTGVPETDIENMEPKAVALAQARLPTVLARGGLLQVKDFTPMVTQVEDLRQWVEECEQERGRKMDALYVDYMDKVGMVDHAGDARGGYEAGRIVSDGLKNLAADKKLWLWTGSQSKRGDNRKKVNSSPKDLDDVADSIEKVRIGHIVITLNGRGDDNDEILFFVAKHRSGKSRQAVGPIPHDFAYGRMAPLNRKEPW
jgi:hypothetical protein